MPAPRNDGRHFRRPVGKSVIIVVNPVASTIRSVTGHSASSIRNQQDALDSQLGQLATSVNPKAGQDKNIEVKVVSVDPFEVVANRYTGEHKGLFAAYGELFTWAQEQGLVEQFRGIYGIPIDDPRDTPDDCRFDCCFDFGPNAETGQRYQKEKLGGGLFAVARHVGPYEGLEEKYDFLFGCWLNQSTFSLRDQAFFNHYVQDPDTVPPEEWETDIYVPIQKAE
jgi:AraC family transcriptional regulator